MEQCPFCAIIRGEDPYVREVIRNQDVVVFFPSDPAILGHCMVVPRHHTENFADLSKSEVTNVMLAVQAMAQAVQHAFRPDGINIIQSNGIAASQSVPHVHVHVVPRWENDSFGEIWPPDTNYSDVEKDRALKQVQVSARLPSSQDNQEDRRQHLAFAQSIIARMAQSSSSAKSWLLPVVTAAYGYAFTQSSFPVAILGIIATLVFGLLDVGYLRIERKYRILYERIASDKSEVRRYSLDFREAGDIRKSIFLEHCSALAAWTIWPFYLTLLLTGIIASLLAT